jgi:hypothetical protein
MHPALRNFIIALALSGGVFAQSQSVESLGEVARANRAKQQAQEAAGTMPKVFTNQDLPSDPPGIPEASASEPMTMVSGLTRSDRHADESLGNRLLAEQRSAELWKARIQDQENRIDDLQARIDRLNALIHSVGTAKSDTLVSRSQAIQMQRLATMQETLTQQKRRLDVMQDAARRSGTNQ